LEVRLQHPHLCNCAVHVLQFIADLESFSLQFITLNSGFAFPVVIEVGVAHMTNSFAFGNWTMQRLQLVGLSARESRAALAACKAANWESPPKSQGWQRPRSSQPLILFKCSCHYRRHGSKKKLHEHKQEAVP
jgi:hypothetical protein